VTSSRSAVRAAYRLTVLDCDRVPDLDVAVAAERDDLLASLAAAPAGKPSAAAARLYARCPSPPSSPAWADQEQEFGEPLAR